MLQSFVLVSKGCRLVVCQGLVSIVGFGFCENLVLRLEHLDRDFVYCSSQALKTLLGAIGVRADLSLVDVQIRFDWSLSERVLCEFSSLKSACVLLRAFLD